MNPAVHYYHRTICTSVSPYSVCCVKAQQKTVGIILQQCKHVFTALFIPLIDCDFVATSTPPQHWHFPAKDDLNARVCKNPITTTNCNWLTVKLLIKASNFVTLGNIFTSGKCSMCMWCMTHPILSLIPSHSDHNYMWADMSDRWANNSLNGDMCVCVCVLRPNVCFNATICQI